MKRKNIYIQRNLSSCGACSIASILSYYNGYVPLEKIKEDTLTNKNGTNAFEIVRVLKKYGFTSYGLNTTLEEIDKKLFPLIAHVNVDGYEHFLVIYDFRDNKVFTMDPAFGKKIYTKKDFELIYDNKVIVSKPNGKIIKMKNSSTLKKYLINSFKNNKKKILIISIFNLIIIVLSIFTNMFLKLMLNQDNIYLISTIFIIIILFKSVFYIIKSLMEAKLSINLEKCVNHFLITHIFKLKPQYLNSKRVGEITQKITDSNEIENVFIKVFLTISLDLLLIIIGTIILLNISYYLCMVMFSVFVLYIIEILYMMNKLKRAETYIIENHNSYYGNLVEYLKGLESIKNINKESYFLNNIFKSHDKYCKSFYKLNKLNVFNCYIKGFIYEFGYIIMNVIGIYFINKGFFNIVDLITFNSIFTLVNNSFLNILNLIPDFIHIKTIFRELSEFMDIGEEANNNHYLRELDNIIVDSLSYSYDYYHYNLKDINLKINKGDKILITGDSGIGKSTLVKCISGGLEDYRGNILINGENIKNISFNSLREFIVYIGQNETLFSNNIKENICFGSFDENKFKRVCELSLVDGIINSKLDKENTPILEGNSNISGGEKARIILARALYKNPKVLIIDETLSNVSEEMENIILEKLLSVENLTLIYITHRNKNRFFKKHIKFIGGKYETIGL